MRHAPRRAQKRDANEPEIVAALEQAGATVMKMNEIDLLVGYRKKDGTPFNALMEVKTLKGKVKEDQQKFIDTWQGAVWVVRTVEQALAILDL